LEFFFQKPLDAKFSIYYINPKEDRGWSGEEFQAH
jgi:hypothetical protein